MSSDFRVPTRWGLIEYWKGHPSGNVSGTEDDYDTCRLYCHGSQGTPFATFTRAEASERNRIILAMDRAFSLGGASRARAIRSLLVEAPDANL